MWALFNKSVYQIAIVSLCPQRNHSLILTTKASDTENWDDNTY